MDPSRMRPCDALKKMHEITNNQSWLGDLRLARGWSPRACILVSLLCSFALVVLVCLHVALLFAFGLAPPNRLLVHYGPLCPGKYTFFSLLRIQCDRCQVGGDPWKVAMVTHLICKLFCPHSLAHFLLCCQLAPTLHFEYCLSTSY